MPACDARVETYATDGSSNGTTPLSKSLGRSSWIQPRARLLMSWMTPITSVRAEIIGTASTDRVW